MDDAGLPKLPPAPDLAELSSCIETVLSREIHGLRTDLQDDLQREMTEMRALMKAILPQPLPVARPKLNRTRSGHSNKSYVSGQHEDQPSHAWVRRSVRSYQAAVEIAAMMTNGSDPGEGNPGAEGLLPRDIPKGSGPLARAQCGRSTESLSSGANSIHSQSRYQKKSDADARRQVSGDVPPAWPASESDSGSFGTLVPQEQHAEKSTAASSSEPQIGAMSCFGSSASRVVPAPDESDNPGPLSKRSVRPQPPGRPSLLARSKTTVKKKFAARLSTILSQHTFDSFEEKGRKAVKGSGRRSNYRAGVLRIVSNVYFDYLTALLIMANASTIGLQTNYMATTLDEHAPAPFPALDIVFSIFFAAEVALRLIAHGKKFFTMPSWRWNILDLVVVSLQLLEELMVAVNIGESQLPVALSLMRMLRILRLVRILRAVRLLRYMSELRRLVVSIMSSMKPLFSSVALLALVIYMVAIYFTQLVLHHRLDMGCGPSGVCDVDSNAELLRMYGSVGKTVFFLFQAVTGGLDWGNMAEPLMTSISPWMGFIYCLYITFTSLALMNLVTGVFVESALQRGREDKDSYMINHLKDLFGAMDMYSNGQISWSELEEHLGNPKLITFFKDVDIDTSEARGLFQLLDRDGSGTIDADEFLSGCLRLRGAAKAIDLQLVMCELSEQRRAFQKLLLALEQAPQRQELPSSVSEASTATAAH